MYVREEKKRFSLWLSATVYNRLDSDSKKYGVAKSTIVQTALVNYYRFVDSGLVSTGDTVPMCQGARRDSADTP